jgi:hypothetical protein
MSGAATLASTLSVSGATTLNSSLVVNGTTTLNSTTNTTAAISANKFFLSVPKGGYVRGGTNSVTGAITITLPTSPGQAMISMWVDVYNYVINTSFTVHVGGYAYGGYNQWYNTFAVVYGAAYTVRFAYSDPNYIIYIGETSSTWAYPQIQVRDVIIGYSPTYSSWVNSIGVSLSTSLADS